MPFEAAGLLSRRTASTAGSTFYTFDERGNTVQRLGSSGTVLTNHVSDAFGTTASSASTSDPYDGYGAQSGYYTDHETGLVLCTFRYFDPANGRWLTRDPIGYAGGVNLYGYVTNNPVNWIDPLGLQTLSPSTNPGGLAEAAECAKDAGSTSGLAPPGKIDVSIPLLGAILNFLLGKRPGPQNAKGGKQRIRDTGLQSWTDEQIAAELSKPGLDPAWRARLVKEQKARGQRNKEKRHEN